MSRNDIKIRNLHLPHIFTRKILTKNNNNNNNQFSELVISEYDLEEILPFCSTQTHFSKKHAYSTIQEHLIEIIRRNDYKEQTIFSFTIYQNKEEENYEILEKDISLVSYPSLNTIFERINNIIEYMDDEPLTITHCFSPYFRLIFSKYETFDNYHNEINKEKIFYSDHCIICSDLKPVVLFCNCGHLCICNRCWLLMIDKKYCCPICREVNTIVREL